MEKEVINDFERKKLVRQTIRYADGSETVINYHKTQNADDRIPQPIKLEIKPE